MNIKQIFPIIAAAIVVALLPPVTRADSFDISLNTSSLSGTTQILAFGLNDSDGSSNTISLTGFSFGGGSATSGTDDCTLGGFLSGEGCSGNLSSGVTLTDSATNNEVFFDQQFTAGTSLSFEMTTTNNFAGGTPDGFAMYLCNSTLTSCYGDDPLGTGDMLVLGLGGTPLSPSSFSLYTGSSQDLPAPVVTTPSSSGTTAPEPSNLLLLATGLIGLIGARGALRGGSRNRAEFKPTSDRL